MAPYRALGITVDTQRNLKIDSEPRSAKNPRAVCYPIDVPDDVRLSIKPIGGFDDYSALFHEMGHGEHYANTTENAMEFKYLGEPTVTENFAFLSEYLLSNQAWIRIHTTMPVKAGEGLPALPGVPQTVLRATLLREVPVRTATPRWCCQP